ncbi:UNVERIFIED_CONTAM: hypothetical protein Sradi_3567700, partial [Sesamum radiatum]
MEIMGVVERPMMEYSFPTADGTISSIVKPAVEANNFEIKRQSFKLFGPVCNSLVYLMRTQINISLIFLRFVILLGLMVLVVMLLDLGFSHSHCVILLKTGFSLYLLLDRESLYDAWERFKSMLRKCPHHELPVWRQVQTFYNGVTLANRVTIDAAAGLLSIHTPALTIRDGVVTPTYHGVTINNKDHKDIINHNSKTHKRRRIILTICSLKFITAVDTRFQNQDASIRNLEVQIGQLVSIVSGRKEGQLPSDTEKNSREQVNAISVRNDRAIGSEAPKEQVEEMPSSAKFLKEVLSTKGKWEGVFNVFKPMKYLHMKEHDIFAIDSINTFGTDNVHLVKCEDSKEDRIENSNEDNLQDMKREHEEVPSFVDTGQEVKSKLQKASEDNWGQPNRMKNRWRNQADKNGGCYKEHTKAWNESHMRKRNSRMVTSGTIKIRVILKWIGKESSTTSRGHNHLV